MPTTALAGTASSVTPLQLLSQSPREIEREPWSTLIHEYLSATASSVRLPTDDVQGFFNWLARRDAPDQAAANFELSIVEQAELRQQLVLARFRQLVASTETLLNSLTCESPYTLVVHPASVVSGTATGSSTLQRAGIVPVCYSDGRQARVLYVGPRTAELLRECLRTGPLPLRKLLSQLTDDEERRRHLDRVRRLAKAGILALTL